MLGGLHWIDVALVLAYLAALAGVGVYFSRRQKSMDDFFLAGRSMGWLPIGLSLMAALNSGIDYLQQPSATVKYGLVMTMGSLSWVFLYFWVAHVTLPFYRRLRIVSAYEYLERRFDVRVRTLAAGIFVIWRLGWMATALYVPCLAVHAATGGKLPLVPLVVFLGVIVTMYTMLGGIQAVIWTDVIQFCVMFSGLAITVVVALANVPGGLAEVWGTAQAAGKTSVIPALAAPPAEGWLGAIAAYFTEPISLSAFLIAVVVGRTAGYTCDQVMIQRFQTTRTLRDSKQAFVINAVGDALWMVGLAVVGLALFSYFHHEPLPPGVSFEGRSDPIFPTFMAKAFPVGVMGLVIAAIIAASLSSLDSAINACTSVIVVDFYHRLIRGREAASGPRSDASQREEMRVSRIATAALGAAGVALAAVVGEIGDLIEISNKVIQSFTGPLLGIYMLGMFSARARAGGVLAAGLLGAVVSAYVAFFTKISFLWPSTFSFLATLVAGYAWCRLVPGEVPEAARRLTWRGVMREPDGEGAEESLAR